MADQEKDEQDDLDEADDDQDAEGADTSDEDESDDEALDDDEADDDASDDDESDDDESDDDESDEDESDEDESDDDEADDDESDDDEADDDESDDDEVEAAADKPRRMGVDEGGRAADVARALGVGDDEDQEDEDADAGPRNRAERRRQRALKRRKGRVQPSGEGEEEPRDRNVRKRDALLKRRRQAAEADDEAPADRLLPSEMVDDALARGGAATVKWIGRNWKWVQWALVAVIFGGVGLGVWIYYSTSSTEDSSDGLAAAVNAEEATVIAPDDDDRTDEQKKFDVRQVYPSQQARDDAALQGYRQVSAEHGSRGAGILATLGEAGLLLDRREWDPAIAAYDLVLGTELAKADVDVKGRALEGKGFAQEGKGELDAALATFTKLAELSEDSFKISSLYHRARVLVAKDQKDQAKELLVEARKQLETAKVDARLVTASAHPYRWIEQAVDDALRRIDPSAVPEKPTPGGGMPALPEDIRRKLQEQGLNPGIPGP